MGTLRNSRTRKLDIKYTGIISFSLQKSQILIVVKAKYFCVYEASEKEKTGLRKKKKG